MNYYTYLAFIIAFLWGISPVLFKFILQQNIPYYIIIFVQAFVYLFSSIIYIIVYENNNIYNDLHENIKYIPQYIIDYKVFDAYLPDYNLVIEIDGIFWHPKSLDECKYEFQKTSYFNDLEKENLLKQKNIKLIRIRENEFPDSIINTINK